MTGPHSTGEHKRITAELHRDHIDGTLCDRCWRPMYHTPALNWDQRPLWAGHPHDQPAGLGGSVADHLEHATCNQTGMLLPEPKIIITRQW